MYFDFTINFVKAWRKFHFKLTQTVLTEDAKVYAVQLRIHSPRARACDSLVSLWMMDDQEHDDRYHATSLAIVNLLNSLNSASPINLEFLTSFFKKATISRIHSLETIYAKSRLVRLLVQKGVHPVFLFASLTVGMAAALQRFYRHSHYLALNLLGVAYPAWQSWRLVKTLPSAFSPPIEEYQAWLTYWILYGSLQGEGRKRPLMPHRRLKERNSDRSLGIRSSLFVPKISHLQTHPVVLGTESSFTRRSPALPPHHSKTRPTFERHREG